MRLLKELKKKPFCNSLHHFLFLVILLLLSIKYIWFIPILFIYLVYIFLKTKLIIPTLIIFLLIFIRLFIFYYETKIEIPKNFNSYVLDIEEDNYILFYKGIKVKVYEKGHNNLPGDIINIEFEKSNIDTKSYESDFNYKEYLYSSDIIYQGWGKTKEYITTTISINRIRLYYTNYLKDNLSKDSYNYIMALVFGKNMLEDNISDSYSVLGISHIMAISGLHILFLFQIISFILLKLFNYYDRKIPLILLFLYICFIGFRVSALRAFLFLLLSELNKKGKIKYTKLDILSISFIILILMNPYQIYQSGFILTFLVSFILIFIKRKNNENKLFYQYKTYLIIYFSTFPFVINITNKISLISFILSPIFSSIICIIILPLSYILTICPILDYGLKYIYIFINNYVLGISRYSLLLNVKSFNIYSIFIYYLIFILLIYFILKGKRIILGFSLLISFLFIYINIDYINPFYKITFIDCGQGDSCLIELPNKKGNILIDAYNSYDYIKNMGISKINYLILTHSDSDHIGDYKELINNLDIDYIYYPIYDDKFNTLLKGIKSYGISSGYSFNLDNIKFNVLGPINKYDSPNLNSIVIKFNIYNKKYLFTGDMEEKEEIDLINKYKKELDSDILKVGHHGSNSSSSINFLDYVKPTYSIISVGENNKYNLPDLEIVNRLKAFGIVYQTNLCGNITIIQKNNYFNIKTYKN